MCLNNLELKINTYRSVIKLAQLEAVPLNLTPLIANHCWVHYHQVNNWG